MSKIYFIRFGDNGPIKIGHSNSVEFRLSMLQSGAPEELKIIKTLDGFGCNLENLIQSKFSKLNIRGEWFRPDEELISFINNLDEKIAEKEFGCVPEKISSEKYVRKHKELVLSSRQHQVLLGTILGGSSIIKSKSPGSNPYLSMRGKHRRWLEYKVSEINVLHGPTSFITDSTNRWHSVCHPVMKKYLDLFYLDKERKITISCLDQLQDVAFAVWFGDAGIFVNELIELNTNCWGKDGNDVINEYFNDLNFNSQIIAKRNSLRIIFDRNSSKEFWKLAEPHFPVWFRR